MVDYQKEFETMKNYKPSESGDYWSPEPGQYKVRALSELEDAEPFEDDEEKKPRARIDIEVDGKKLTWGMAKGKSLVSAYGQLINLAVNKGLKLTDLNFIVVVIGKDRERRFTIVL